MTKKESKQTIKQINDFVACAEERFRVPPPRRRRNPDGLPTLFWPADTSTFELFDLCFRAWNRGMAERDVSTFICIDRVIE